MPAVDLAKALRIPAEHSAVVVTFDADFDRFPGVRWMRPAAPEGR